MSLDGGQDIEVEDEESSEDDLDYDGECRFPFQLLLLELTHGMTAGPGFDTSNIGRGRNESEPALDYRMAGVVRRYEAHASKGEGHGEQDERETRFDVEVLASLTERAMRMPTAQDSNFWIVSVYVSPWPFFLAVKHLRMGYGI